MGKDFDINKASLVLSVLGLILCFILLISLMQDQPTFENIRLCVVNSGFMLLFLNLIFFLGRHKYK